MKKLSLILFLLFQLLSFGQEEPKEPIKMPVANEEGKEEAIFGTTA